MKIEAIFQSVLAVATVSFMSVAGYAQSIEETAGFIMTGIPLGTHELVSKTHAATFSRGTLAGKGAYRVVEKDDPASDFKEFITIEIEVKQVSDCVFQRSRAMIWLPGADGYNKIKSNRDVQVSTLDFRQIETVLADGANAIVAKGPKISCNIFTPTDIKCSDAYPFQTGLGGAKRLLAAFEHMDKNFCKRRAF